MIVSYPQGTRKAIIKRVFNNKCSILMPMEIFIVNTVFQKLVFCFNKNNRVHKNINIPSKITQI